MSLTLLKNKKLVLVDPRKESVVQEGSAHSNHKDSRVLWLGDTGKIATAAYSSVSALHICAIVPVQVFPQKIIELATSLTMVY